MSRSGYSEEHEPLELGRWRGAVMSAIRGQRGQSLLRDLRAALDAMPDKRLVAGKLVNESGEYCTLGVLGAERGIDLGALDPDDYDSVASAFGVNAKLVQEIVFENDERDYRFRHEKRNPVEVGPKVPYAMAWVRYELDEAAERWSAMSAWVTRHINAPG